jgi:hypothetical protein
VDDSVPVRVGERVGDPGTLLARQAAALERAAGEELHDDAGPAVELRHVEGAHEVRVVEPCRDPRFPQEAVAELAVPG